jgi:hypothetical protein
MTKNYIVKNTMYISFYVQIITLIIGLLALFIKTSPNKLILKEALILENIVQFIEGAFYLWFIYFYTKNVDKVDIAKYRYYDWFFTTPTMILSAIAYFQYNNLKSKTNSFTLIEFIKNNFEKITRIFSYNFGMLFIGYLQEIKLINIWFSTFFGFIFFGLMFSRIFYDFTIQSKANYPIFFIMVIIWSIYGIAATFNFKLKNAFYNILDLFSKNFYGLFLSYLIFKT